MVLRKKKEAPGILDKFSDSDKKQIIHGLQQLANSSSDEGKDNNTRLNADMAESGERDALNSAIVNRSTQHVTNSVRKTNEEKLLYGSYKKIKRNNNNNFEKSQISFNSTYHESKLSSSNPYSSTSKARPKQVKDYEKANEVLMNYAHASIAA